MSDQPKYGTPILTEPLRLWCEQQRIFEEIKRRAMLAMAIPKKLVDGDSNYSGTRALIVRNEGDKAD